MSELDFDGRPDLPSEAGNLFSNKFNPDDTWLAKAPRELQIEAMRQWFYARYQDPANDTPYNGREGGYIFVNGGPHDPNDRIQERFDGLVEYDVMEELIDELHQEPGGDRWAPIDQEVDYEWEYENFYSTLPEHRTDPLIMLNERLKQIEETLTQQSQIQGFVIQLLHSSTITALEAYLWDTTAYWVTKNKDILRSFVNSNEDFSQEKLKLSDIFVAMDGLEKKIIEYLQKFIWHRLDKAKPLLEKTLKIKFPSIEKFMPEIIIRHDIVHRGGRDKDGYPVLVAIADVRRVSDMVSKFSRELEAELKKAFPITVDPSTPIAPAHPDMPEPF
jgi:hypothetical protein